MPPPVLYRAAVYASSEFFVRRIGTSGHKFLYQRMWVQLESINEVTAPPAGIVAIGGGGAAGAAGAGGGGAPRLSVGERVTAFELRMYAKAPLHAHHDEGIGAQQQQLLMAQKLTQQTGCLVHSGVLEVQFSAETLQLKSDTEGHLREWCAMLERYIRESAHVNAAQQEWERRVQEEERVRAAAVQAEMVRLAAQRERKQQLDDALNYASVARQQHREGDFKASCVALRATGGWAAVC
jgi:hypothetical protein